MTAHKWAREMMQYAQDAAETDAPWRRWQFRIDNDGTWRDCCFNTFMFSQFGNYRRKPQTIQCNGFEVEKPMKKIDNEAHYYTPIPSGPEWYCQSIYECYNEIHECRLVRGLVHATREGAIAHAKAMCGIDPEGEK